LDTLNAAAKNVEFISHGPPVLVRKADVSSETDVKILYEKVKAKFGKADALVNSAGTMGGGLVGEVEPSACWQDFVSSYP
jgi:NAD(P)-dependent dehydrogenase (short-subunit alcohol dehydrogenase family)